MCLFKEKKYDQSINYLFKGLDIDEKDLSLLNSMGEVYYELRNLNKSEKYYLKALELKPNNIGTLNHVAECYERVKSFEDSKKYYNKVLEFEPKNKIALKGLSRILIKFGFHKQGLNYFQKSAGLIRFSKEGFKIIS